MTSVHVFSSFPYLLPLAVEGTTLIRTAAYSSSYYIFKRKSFVTHPFFMRAGSRRLFSSVPTYRAPKSKEKRTIRNKSNSNAELRISPLISHSLNYWGKIFVSLIELFLTVLLNMVSDHLANVSECLRKILELKDANLSSLIKWSFWAQRNPFL